MDPPVRDGGDYILDKNVKILKFISAVRVEDRLTGQYIANEEG